MRVTAHTFSILLLLLASSQAFAIDIFVVRIFNDYNPKKSYDLILDVQRDGHIKGIKTRNNKKNKTKFYPPTVLGKPMTLLKAAGITLITIECRGFKPDQGCDIVIEYPSNIVLGQFKKFHSRIKMVQGRWGIYSTDNKKFTRMYLLSKKILGVITGIKAIELK